MAWVGDHIFSYGQAFAGAMCVACPESPETIIEDRREIAPTYFFAPPRVYENLLTQIMVRMEDAGRLKKGMFDYFLKVARRSGEKILDGKPVGLKERLLYGSATSASTRRCATAWASPRSASPTRPARPSGRSCSASTARSAST